MIYNNYNIYIIMNVPEHYSCDCNACEFKI